MTIGCRSEVAQIRRLLLKHVKDGFIDQAHVDHQWRELNYSGAPVFLKALSEYEAFLDLMAFISPIDHDLAVVYSRLMPVAFREFLLDRGMKLLDVPDEEYESMGCNVLTVAPRKCIMLTGNPRTKKMIEDEGVEVTEYIGEEISKKGGGGPTCLTRPLHREE